MLDLNDVVVIYKADLCIELYNEIKEYLTKKGFELFGIEKIEGGI